jgi:hypothetical protein
MPKVHQLAVASRNRPGTLAHIAKVMGDAGVNIEGFLLTTSGSKGQVKLVVDDVDRAKEALEEAALRYTEQPVLHVRLRNVPGALARLAGKMAARKINITSGYQTIEKDSRKASVVLEVSNLARALRLSRDTPSGRIYEE